MIKESTNDDVLVIRVCLILMGMVLVTIVTSLNALI